ncbi:DUF1540 domain-containing protein [Bacillus suaedae]|uniref:DUF1540 domain-containing protein n=1 Tax=Halalkalibacter suaedae TaxID=2822140 RepID=A0A941AN52_9BACI|nr:DUF1540 domain-containing protein [Bacillus suaedae]MBP3951265.1 DUF1540 domain-containing protein [Bacillus suaedae]
MDKPLVKCNVANCTFWGEGNKCQADSILVEIDAHANRDYTMEAGEEPYEMAEHKDKAKNIAQTCCHTFRPKES